MLLNGVSTFVQCFTTSYQGSSQMTRLYKYVLSVYCFVCNALLIYLSAVVSRLLVCMHSWDTGTFSHKNVFWVRVQSSQGQNYKWTKCFHPIQEVKPPQFLKSILNLHSVHVCQRTTQFIQKHIYHGSIWKLFIKVCYVTLFTNWMSVISFILCCTVIFCY